MSDFFIICGILIIAVAVAKFVVSVLDKLTRRRSSRDWRGSWTDEDGNAV